MALTADPKMSLPSLFLLAMPSLHPHDPRVGLSYLATLTCQHLSSSIRCSWPPPSSPSPTGPVYHVPKLSPSSVVLVVTLVLPFGEYFCFHDICPPPDTWRQSSHTLHLLSGTSSSGFFKCSYLGHVQAVHDLGAHWGETASGGEAAWWCPPSYLLRPDLSSVKWDLMPLP